MDMPQALTLCNILASEQLEHRCFACETFNSIQRLKLQRFSIVADVLGCGWDCEVVQKMQSKHALSALYPPLFILCRFVFESLSVAMGAAGAKALSCQRTCETTCVEHIGAPWHGAVSWEVVSMQRWTSPDA